MLFKMEHVAKKNMLQAYKQHNINYVAKVKKNEKVNFLRSASLTKIHSLRFTRHLSGGQSRNKSSSQRLTEVH